MSPAAVDYALFDVTLEDNTRLFLRKREFHHVLTFDEELLPREVVQSSLKAADDYLCHLSDGDRWDDIERLMERYHESDMREMVAKCLRREPIVIDNITRTQVLGSSLKPGVILKAILKEDVMPWSRYSLEWTWTAPAPISSARHIDRIQARTLFGELT